MEKFEFTYDIYTGEKKPVLVDINELILGIATALEFDDPIAYAGNRDEQDDVPSFGIDSDYIRRLRRSPEYHDSVYQYLLRAPAYACSAQWRKDNFGVWARRMFEHGVIGVVSLYPYFRYNELEVNPNA